jgi:hypothetical protein
MSFQRRKGLDPNGRSRDPATMAAIDAALAVSA